MPVYVWLILAAILIVIEIFTAGFFIACFAIGAIFAAAVTYLFDFSFLWQCLVFVIVSLLLIPLSRILAKRLNENDTPQAGIDALIGQTAIVIEDIDPNSQKGQIRIDGEAWRAIASVEIKTGEAVKLISIKGTMFEVEKIEGSK